MQLALLLLMITIYLIVVGVLLVWLGRKSVYLGLPIALLGLAPLFIVFGEIVLARFSLLQSCRSDAGLHLYHKTPEPATRIRIESSRDGMNLAEQLLQTFSFLQEIEAQDPEKPGAYVVYSRTPTGKMMFKPIDASQSSNTATILPRKSPSLAKYILAYTYSAEAFGIEKWQYSLRTPDGHFVATLTSFAYPGKTVLFAEGLASSACGWSTQSFESFFNHIAPSPDDTPEPLIAAPVAPPPNTPSTPSTGAAPAGQNQATPKPSKTPKAPQKPSNAAPAAQTPAPASPQAPATPKPPANSAPRETPRVRNPTI